MVHSSAVGRYEVSSCEVSYASTEERELMRLAWRLAIVDARLGTPRRGAMLRSARWLAVWQSDCERFRGVDRYL